MNRRRDQGAVLPLVLVLTVIGALIVVPVLSYAVAVLRANAVQSERTKSIEAAKGGIRVALDDPADVFNRCNNTADLTPVSGVVAGRTVTVRCTEIDETGPLEVLGFEIPHGAVAMQLGATVPTSFSGTTVQSPPVPPYPVAPDDEAWWRGQESPVAEVGKIWLPQLPAVPSVARSSTPFGMPAGFDCSVFLPGKYSDPLTLSGNVYFASGVYYFEDTVTVSGDADVVVGQGIEDFGTDCADDIQVAANIIGSPGTFAIDGGGGTWIFGDGGNLVIDNSTTTTSLSVRFNQRYADDDQGSRVSIMSVNGDDVAPVDHQVTDVVKIDRSTVFIDGQPPISLGQPGATYLPSTETFTSKVRLPQPPATVTATPSHDHTVPPPIGTALVTWSEVTGQDAGGALVDGYEVTVTPSPAGGPACPASEVVPSGAGEFSCLVRGLTLGTSYTIDVATRNEAGTGTPSSGVTITPLITDPDVMWPDEPTITALTEFEDAAEIAWTAPNDNGAPIVGYDVKAYRVYLEPDVPPLPPIVRTQEVGSCSTVATAWVPAAESCVVTGLPGLEEPPDVDPIDGFENVGYQFSVSATNVLGRSIETIVDPPGGPWFEFDGGTPPDPPDPLVRVVEPWIPQPIVDVQAAGTASTTVSVAGYVAVPMGRLNVENPNGHSVKINGGTVVSTYTVNDSREDLAVPGSLPIGFKNDIVLQREIRMVSTADNVRSIAIVKVNEDGASYAVTAWVTQ